MAHDNHTTSSRNKAIDMINQTRFDYLQITEGFESKLPPIEVRYHDGVTVVREDLALPGGTKTRAAEFMFSKIKEDVVVYVAPRTGLAPSAIMDLCEMYDKEVIFFMPSSKEISDHQAAVIHRKPKEVHFRRIAAMPNLNRIAKKYAEENGYKFLPFGLDDPLVIAGFVRACEQVRSISGGRIHEVWSAVSTGVLTRGLQIGFPDACMFGVAVARNIKEGEKGRTFLYSDPLPFNKDEKEENLPPFDTVPNYDGKVWKYIPKEGEVKRLFWNVAGNLHCPKDFDKSKINSYRDW